LGPHAFEELVQKKLKAPGDSVEALVFVPEFYQKCGKEKAVFERVEDVDILGTKMKLRRIALHLEVLPASRSSSGTTTSSCCRNLSCRSSDWTLPRTGRTPEAVAREDFSSPPEVLSIDLRTRARQSARGRAADHVPHERQIGPFVGDRGEARVPGGGPHGVTRRRVEHADPES
jgi:hypothetical protein